MEMNQYLGQLKRISSNQHRRLDEVSDYSHVLLKPIHISNERVYYSARSHADEKFRYLGCDSKQEVQLIREARYLARSVAALDNDILLIEDFLEKYESVSFSSIASSLPKTYRPESLNTDIRNEAAKRWKQKAEAYKATFEPFRPEELIHRTVDGTMVRSKSEQSIYNYLFGAGYTFVYELPLEARNKLFLPDFTILSEIDYKTEVRIEHQGMYGENDYRDRSEAREYDYWNNGFLPARDVYFTFDDNKGGFDIQPILEILRVRVRPDSDDGTNLS